MGIAAVEAKREVKGNGHHVPMMGSRFFGMDHVAVFDGYIGGYWAAAFGFIL